jgi:hypothetical protein
VVGVANTGHDVAEDMANASMDVTMVQRGPTFILPVEWLHAAEDIDYHPGKKTSVADRQTITLPNKITRESVNGAVHRLTDLNAERFDALEKAGFKLQRHGDLLSCLFDRIGGHYIDIGASARIANGEIKVTGKPIKGLTPHGLAFEDDTEILAEVVVVATGFSHDFRADAARIIGAEAAEQMDDYGGLDAEGEMRGQGRLSGRKWDAISYPLTESLVAISDALGRADHFVLTNTYDRSRTLLSRFRCQDGSFPVEIHRTERAGRCVGRVVRAIQGLNVY